MADFRAEQQAIDQAIEAGVALHQRGLIDDAERLYRRHPEARAAAFRRDASSRGHSPAARRQRRALKFIGAALELNDASADAYDNHGKVLLQLRRFDEALVSIERALALVPDHPQALINRAAIRIE